MGIQPYQGMGFWIQITSYIDDDNSSSRRDLVVPLTADVTTANVPDNKMYVPITSSHHSVFSLPSVLYMIADPGYDAKNLYEYSKRHWE